jgi:Domain of unknown function (DUF4139)
MHHAFWILSTLASAITVSSPPQPATTEESLELTHVMLSTGGVGYFEYETTVQGAADLPLRVRLDQMDDVLKSIVVYDEHGNLGQARFAGKELLKDTLRESPFREEDLASTAALLEALRGAEVRVELAGSVVTGKVVSVNAEPVKLPNGDTVMKHRLTLLSAGALTTLVVEDITRVTLVDPALEAQLEAAIGALAGQRDREGREITLHIDGEGERVVRVAYVAEAPLWKSTYRLTLPGAPAATTAVLEAFAVVENRSGKAWNDVELTLSSGNPVTFRQALYETYYVTRPKVPVEVFGRVLPPPDEGGISAPHAMSGFERALDAASFGERAYRSAIGLDAGALPKNLAIESEQAAQVTFRLPEPVSLENGQSMLVPLLERALPAERVSLYQPEVEARHPLSSVRLTNDGSVDLPPGAVALYESAATNGGSGAYVGDARLSFMPAGASRFVSFAVDLRVTIDKSEASAQTLTLARIIDGALSLTRTERRSTTYTIAGATDKARTVVLEHPRLSDFTLLPSAEYEMIEALTDRYRLRVREPAGRTTALTVTQDRPLVESVSVTDLSDEQIGVYATSSELPPAIREALIHVASLRRSVADAEAVLSRLEAEAARITADQARIRENLKAVPAGSDLHERYLAKLTEEEDRLSALGVEIRAAQGSVAHAKEALTAYLRGLSL